MIRRALFSILFAIIALACNAQNKVEYSETVELMGILSRTAGYPEYCMDMAGTYTQETEAWFAPYRNHPAVPYCQSLIQL